MLSESVKEAWQINTRINKEVLEHLTPEMINAQTPGDGLSGSRTLTRNCQHA